MMMMTVQIFWKYRGHDHFVFFSITINQMVGIGVKVFFMEICQNCTGTDALFYAVYDVMLCC